MHALSAIEDQPFVENVINGPESDDWKWAINEELTQIEKLGTWELVEVPNNANVIPCRWVLRRKRNTQGQISRYKARLVAKGFRQQFSVDYTDTFAPTVRPATLRILLALGAANGNDIIIEQADVKNAYLNTWMHDDEIVFMDLPKFYETFRRLPENFKRLTKSGKRVVLLKRPLYGTKQGAHHWYEELKRILLSFDFKVSVADEATFYKVDDDNFLVIAAATDDFTIVTNSRSLSTKTKADLNRHFELVDLGDLVVTLPLKDVLWIHKILREFSFLHNLSLPSNLYCDNQGAIRLSKDATFHGRTKHIDVHFHFIRQTITSGNMELIYIPTEKMVADIFTKSLARVKFERFRADLNVM